MFPTLQEKVFHCFYTFTSLYISETKDLHVCSLQQSNKNQLIFHICSIFGGISYNSIRPLRPVSSKSHILIVILIN